MQNAGNVMPGTSKCFIVIMDFTQNPVARQARDKNHQWTFQTYVTGTLQPELLKREVTRFVPHSNKNQFNPIYSISSHLLKQIFA